MNFMEQENNIQIIKSAKRWDKFKFKKEFKKEYGKFNLYKSNNCKHPIILSEFTSFSLQISFMLSDECIMIQNFYKDYYYELKEIINYFETKSYFAILYFGFSTKMPEIVLIKKEDISDAQKEKLINILKPLCIDKEKEIKWFKPTFAIAIVFIILVSLIAILEIEILNSISDSSQNQVRDAIKKEKVLIIDENSPNSELGLKPYDILVEVNGIDVKRISAKKLQDMLKGKNVKVKVLKRETGEFAEYKINQNNKKVEKRNHE